MRIFLFEEEEVKRKPGTTPARPASASLGDRGAQESPHIDNPVTPSFIIFVLSLILLPFVGYYTYQWTQAGTTINTTITTNDDLESGLVGHWTFDGPDTSWTTLTTTDVSGNGNAGTLTSMATATTPTIGRLGQALDFDGTDDVVVVADAAELQPGANRSWTMSAWAKPDTADQYGTILSRRQNGGNFPEYAIKICNSGCTAAGKRMYAIYRQAGGVYRISVSSSTVSSTTIGDGRWHHFVAVASQSEDNVILYIDGERIPFNTGSAGAWPSFTNGNDFQIGNCSGCTSYFNGAIDDVRIYNRGFSNSEVKRLYELGATTHINTTIDTNDDLENGLVGHWTFDGPKMDWASTTAEVRDQSTSSNHGNATNMNQTSATIGKLGQGLQFDGTDDYVRRTDNASLRVTSGVSLVAWVKTVSTSTSQYVVSKYNIHIASREYALRVITGGLVRGIVSYNGGLGEHYRDSSVAVNDGRWHLIVMTFRATGFVAPDIYVDGQLSNGSGAAPANFTAIYSGTSDAHISGTVITGGSMSEFFNGQMDDVRIYNRGLSASEVKRIYDLGATTHINTTITENDDLASGLVGHWTFDGPKMAWASTTAEVLDSSTSGREGDMINMDMQSVAIGKIGQGLDFNGTDDRVEIPYTSVFPSTDFTVALWAFLDANTDEVFVMLPDGVGQNEFLMHASSSLFGVTTNSLGTTYGSVPIPTGKWTHIVARRSGSSVTSYINAVQDLSYTDGNALEITSCRLYFGVDIDAGSCTTGLSNFLDGKLDDIRIYNRALSAAEIKRLYELGGGQ